MITHKPAELELLHRLDTTRPVGLCMRCVHSLVNVNDNGGIYLRCAAAHDPRLAEFPHLPVNECVGFTREAADADPGRPSSS
jgi:hypothetical protein